MKRRLSLVLTASVVAAGLMPTLARADLYAGRFDDLDKAGVITPGFKAAVRAYVESKQALEQAEAENKKFAAEKPDLEAQAKAAAAKAVALREELAKYEHPDETDFTALQHQMSDPTAQLKDQITMAQAYVWSYPASPHESDAQQYLQQAQKKLADQIEAEKEAEAQRAADHAKMVQRAQARDLSLSEWRGFLRDMSQDDLVKLIGQPSSTSDDYWTYSGAWVADPATHQKVGLQINFSAGRVLNVDEVPPPP